MLLVTAPSKTQSPYKHRCRTFTTPRLLTKSNELIELLRPLSAADLAELMHMSPRLGDSTTERIRSFSLPLTPKNSSQALFTFRGDAYDQLTPLDYSDEQLTYAQHHLRILSGLYGVLRPLDLMFPYRLEMGLKLQNKAGSTLYKFWGERITAILNEDLGSQRQKTVVNLASTEYARAVLPEKLAGRWLTITFRQRKGDRWGTIPIFAKRARGAMIHFALINRIERAEQLKTFDLDGYRFNADHSTEDHWIFLRELTEK